MRNEELGMNGKRDFLNDIFMVNNYCLWVCFWGERLFFRIWHNLEVNVKG